jgi:hypothetical protein
MSTILSNDIIYDYDDEADNLIRSLSTQLDEEDNYLWLE